MVAANPTPPHPSPKKIVTLESLNPLDMTLEELADLSATMQKTLIQASCSDVEIEVRGENPHGAGHGWIDALEVVLPSAEFMKEAVWGGLLAAATAFMRSRFKRKHESKRPRQIRFYDSEGNHLGSINIDSAESDDQWTDPPSEPEE
ncbi:hypothetical protein ACFPIJ_64220 [Dactylosporangium cerinum]|uniref:Uncharacterized protein n=1 Tax=Dactylosporangium cerinum TaxID=1434730 RepID=A0ABV9WIW3_9ACTN